MTDPDFTHDVFVSFGDCDPAGIVFYPNFFRFFDRTFHAWLVTHGGHRTICERIGARGIGLIEVNARFRAPLAPGDTATVALWAEHWGARAFRLGYRISCGERLCATGTETRTVFVDTAGGMVSGDVRRLQALLSADAS